MRVKATKFRQNLYRFLDRVIETGLAVEIERKGRVVKVIVEEKKSRLDNLRAHDVYQAPPEDIINTDWSAEWEGGKNL